MTRSYEAIITDRRDGPTPESVAQRGVFEKACDIAPRVVDPHEKQGRTQEQLVDRQTPPSTRATPAVR